MIKRHDVRLENQHQLNAVRDVILGDDALLSITYVMRIWASLIPAARWSCKQPQADSNDCCLQLHIVAGIRSAQISITDFMLSALSP